jgi:hypothetical protein
MVLCSDLDFGFCLAFSGLAHKMKTIQHVFSSLVMVLEVVAATIPHTNCALLAICPFPV